MRRGPSGLPVDSSGIPQEVIKSSPVFRGGALQGGGVEGIDEGNHQMKTGYGELQIRGS
jgi:hypothetical protein